MMGDRNMALILAQHELWVHSDGERGKRADLQGAELMGANLEGISLVGANLWRTDLTGANLKGADLKRADLRSACLRGADLRGANLMDADISGIDFSGANLEGVKFITEGTGMKMSDYAEKAAETAVWPDNVDGMVYTALGLTSEVGEVADLIKKKMRGDAGAAQRLNAEIEKELGDVLWYLTMLARSFGLTLEDIARTNLYKLENRRKRGVLKGSGDHR